MESDPIGLWLLLLLALFVLYALLSAVDAASRAVNTNRLRKEILSLQEALEAAGREIEKLRAAGDGN